MELNVGKQDYKYRGEKSSPQCTWFHVQTLDLLLAPHGPLSTKASTLVSFVSYKSFFIPLSVLNGKTKQKKKEYKTLSPTNQNIETKKQRNSRSTFLWHSRRK